MPLYVLAILPQIRRDWGKKKRLLTGRNRERDQVRTEVQEAELTQVGGMAEAEKAEHRNCLQHHKSL